MDNVEIFVMDNSELAQFEAINKGYRRDLYVKIKEDLFNIKVYDIFTLKQCFERELEEYGYYLAESNSILVKQVTNEDIIHTIQELYKQKYFEEIKSVEQIDISSLVKIN